MSKIRSFDVRHIAKLANLALTQKELELFGKQFSQILSYIDQLSKIDTDSVKPTFQTLDNTTNIFRQDQVFPSLSQFQSLNSSFHTYQGYFVADHVFSKQKKAVSKASFLKIKKPLDYFQAVLTSVNSQGNLGHKDLFCTQGVQTTAGSLVLFGYRPAYSATIVKQLEKLGWVTKFKLNQDAWGHGSSGENSDYGSTHNPWEIHHVPGGSSSGSAVMVAVKEVALATGTDTCGSIRLPSCFTNICGIKPTYGALSRFGVIAFASSLDCPGLFAKTVKKLESVFAKLSVPDKLDATSQSSARKTVKLPSAKIVGLPEEFLQKGIDPQVKKAVLKAAGQLSNKGLKVKSISLPHSPYGVAAYYIIAPTETSSNLSRYDGVRYGHSRHFFGPEAKRRIMLGTFASSAGYSAKYYEKAAKIRTLIIKDFNKVFDQIDVILAPISPTPPFKLGEKTSDPLTMYLSDIYAAPASLAGLPSLAIPCGFTKDNLPIGMQLIGPRWSEPRLFELGKKYQSITNWHLKEPKI